jgi:hypothetical protein
VDNFRRRPPEWPVTQSRRAHLAVRRRDPPLITTWTQPAQTQTRTITCDGHTGAEGTRAGPEDRTTSEDSKITTAAVVLAVSMLQPSRKASANLLGACPMMRHDGKGASAGHGHCHEVFMLRYRRCS